MSAPTPLRVDDWKAGNDELDRKFLAAMSNKDVDGAMACFLDSPDLVAVIWGNELRGPQQLREALLGLFAKYDEIKLSIDRVREFRSGEAVIAVGQATYEFRQADVKTKLTEIWTDLRRSVNGRWVYVLDHAEILPT